MYAFDDIFWDLFSCEMGIMHSYFNVFSRRCQFGHRHANGVEKKFFVVVKTFPIDQWYITGDIL